MLGLFNLPATYLESLKCLVVSTEEQENLKRENPILEQQKQMMEPKADYYDDVV